MNILAIDSGNTRIKWGLHDGKSWARRGAVDQGDRAGLHKEWREIAAPARVVVANVAGDNARALISDLVSRWKAGPAWIRSEAAQCGVKNGYKLPGQLGCDRWAAAIGAWHLLKRGCVVVNVGTAMTVDVLSVEGVFRGGIIVPGVALMQQALAGNTAALKQQPGAFTAFPDNTGDAIASGAVQALAGAVERMAAAGGVTDCVLSGGAAEVLEPRLRLDVTRVDQLVLEGLVCIALERNR